MSKELIKKYQIKNIEKHFSFDAFDTVVLLFKKQNKNLLTLMGEYKSLEDDDLEEFIDEFLKIGFYMPNITKNKCEEDVQIRIIKKKMKNIKKN